MNPLQVGLAAENNQKVVPADDIVGWRDDQLARGPPAPDRPSRTSTGRGPTPAGRRPGFRDLDPARADRLAVRRPPDRSGHGQNGLGVGRSARRRALPRRLDEI